MVRLDPFSDNRDIPGALRLVKDARRHDGIGSPPHGSRVAGCPCVADGHGLSSRCFQVLFWPCVEADLVGVAAKTATAAFSDASFNPMRIAV